MWRSVPVFLLGLLGLAVAALALEPPVADFSWEPSEPSTRDTVHFHDRSRDPDGWIVSWRWDFGDGHTSSERNPSHRYSRPGTYTVTLEVTDDDGLTDTESRTIHVHGLNPPRAAFSWEPEEPLVGQEVRFHDESTDDRRIVSRRWDFGDGSTSTERNPTHVYRQPGSYTVRLRVKDDDGLSDTESHTIHVREGVPPKAAFSWEPEKPYTGDEVRFHDESTDDREVVAWHWDFGDGSTSDERNPVHTYTFPGAYTVTLVVADDDGLTGTATARIEVGIRGIQEGELAPLIEETEPGGTLFLEPGIYYANVTIAKDIRIKGAGPDKTLIVGRGSGIPTLRITGGEVWLKNLAIGRGAGSGIVVEGGTLRALGIRVAWNQGSGLVLRDGWIWIRESRFDMNGFHGMALLGGEARLEDNVIVNNRGYDLFVSEAWVEGSGNVVTEDGARGVPEGLIARTVPRMVPPIFTELWRFKAESTIHSPPVVGPQGRIYFGSDDGRLYALDPDGTPRWTFAAGGAIRASPAVGPVAIYFGSDDGNFYALDPDGSLLWTFAAGGPIRSAPIVGPDGTIYFGSDDGKLYALNPDGTPRWEFATGGEVRTSPALGPDGAVYVGSADGKLYALSPDGEFKWAFAAGGTILSSPAVGDDGLIYFGADDGKLYVLNPSGTLIWTFAAGGPIRSSPLFGPGGVVYFGCDDGYLYAVWPIYRMLWWRFPAGGEVRTSPALGADGTIYFASAVAFWALDRYGTPIWTLREAGVLSPALGAGGSVCIALAGGELRRLGKKETAWAPWPCFRHDPAHTGRAEGNPFPWPMFRHDPAHSGRLPSGRVRFAFWPMFRGNPRHTGVTFAAYTPACEPLKWKFETGAGVGSSPAIGPDGTIYFGSDGFYALNPDGTLKWKFETGSDVWSSPAIGPDGTIYFGSWDNYLYALNPDGTLKWKFETGDDVYSSPAIGPDGTIYFGSDDHYLYALNPDGTLKWRFETGYDVESSPAIGPDGTIYFGSLYGYLYALNPDGTLKWKFEAGGYSSPAIGYDGTIYVGSGYYLYALRPCP